jgi:hypothetical protein
VFVWPLPSLPFLATESHWRSETVIFQKFAFFPNFRDICGVQTTIRLLIPHVCMGIEVAGNYGNTRPEFYFLGTTDKYK